MFNQPMMILIANPYRFSANDDSKKNAVNIHFI